MNTLDLISSVPGGPTEESSKTDLFDVARDAPVGVVQRQTFDSAEWTFRNGFGDVLSAFPAQAWREPETQPGWKRIKHNGTREVWRAKVTGRIYYLKYYANRGLSARARNLFRVPACQAEWNGGIYALKAGIAAVEPSGYAPRLARNGGTQALLVTEAVEPAYTLNDFWRQLHCDDDHRRARQDATSLLNLLGEMIARAHQAGFEHLDMHAANILVQPISRRRYRTLFVDLHSARLGLPVSGRAVVRNLAQLNQWFRKNASIGDRLRFLRGYYRWRNEYEQSFEHARPLEFSFGQLVRELADEAEVHARRLWAQRDRRVRRDGRYFSKVRLSGGWRGMVYARCKHKLDESPASGLTLDKHWWRAQLQKPLRWFQAADTESYKDSHSAIVARAVLKSTETALPVIIKRPLARNARRALSRRFGSSRSMRGWRIGHALLHRDVPAARPLAVLERKIGPLILDSVLITEALPDAADLEADLRREYGDRNPLGWFRYKRRMAERLALHLRRLRERGFCHRDCKAGNILVVPGREPKLLWIDMDGLRLSPRLSSKRMLDPLVRLHVSLLEIPGLTRTDRARFLKTYFARFGGDARRWRAAWREIDGAADKKIAAKRARREWKLAHYGRG